MLQHAEVSVHHDGNDDMLRNIYSYNILLQQHQQQHHLKHDVCDLPPKSRIVCCSFIVVFYLIISKISLVVLDCVVFAAPQNLCVYLLAFFCRLKPDVETGCCCYCMPVSGWWFGT